MFWFQQGLCILPVILVTSSSATFIISYIIAILRRDVDVFLPYISDTGNSPPESCIFGLMTFVSACAGVSTIYAMYKFMAKLGEDTGTISTCWNKAALGFGLISCFGMCVVATFQETAVETVHLIGALLFFLCGALYISLETYLSYCSYPYGSSLFICRARFIISVISVVAFFPTVICKFLEKDPLLQKTSAGCEWIVAFSFISYFYTYVHDFKQFTLKFRTVCRTGT
ncbi:DNA damage-regulated autophagy modulator protein 1 [Periophthalmus magnuspinnatus]|uniref:DNA damage-regulated autophagy modulator protein 1-like n=1 Tax=Periophthalmus magnuspinnatus TaxID=409849 RepID=UPI00145AC1DF|nr:DNA damage-regulated autophagy modulator protein 1-like [Periophthalmus magnuspinnatus]XP_033845614.1 DNA damage-regulated autophagy modulator protein 1 [Periophthalmus magnuspinnatus]